jgi:hypothetical protein
VHAAGEPVLDDGAGDAGGFAEFIGGLAGADERAGENDFREDVRVFQELGCAVSLLAAFGDEFACTIATGVGVFSLAVAE